MGVVVRRYIDILIIIITFPYFTCINSFFGSSIPYFVHFVKVFLVLYKLLRVYAYLSRKAIQ